ncbi:hypothetical protein [Nonomuraea soli]|uniref:Catalytic LigB subunit of aromatic ring-opening dioxygenase n=1 Tax=Nonomuraea soli TaxID=1032476 RepID=A0A7W0HMP3_9ACTN|nr:hypothetical protein [Nonomuraea soli]MBA2888984.1 hypothetical protein [Nonomuraea soli]
MLVAAAVCPHPPLIVPELAGAAAPELDGLRAACASALDTVLATDHDVLLVVGAGPSTRRYGGRAAGSLRPWGVDVRAGEGEPELPLSLTIGRWLLGRDPDGFQAVDDSCDAVRLGGSLGDGKRLALLVMADGSACLTEKSPGFLDPAALPYQEKLTKALSEADAAALAALDPEEAARLWVGGRAALQVLAGAAGEGAYRGRVLADLAPYGVGYTVAAWTASAA